MSQGPKGFLMIYWDPELALTHVDIEAELPQHERRDQTALRHVDDQPSGEEVLMLPEE